MFWGIIGVLIVAGLIIGVAAVVVLSSDSDDSSSGDDVVVATTDDANVDLANDDQDEEEPGIDSFIGEGSTAVTAGTIEPNQNDWYQIVGGSIENDTLSMEVQFGGGCSSNHAFDVVTAREGDSIAIGLTHDRGDDFCEALVSDTLRVELADVFSTLGVGGTDGYSFNMYDHDGELAGSVSEGNPFEASAEYADVPPVVVSSDQSDDVLSVIEESRQCSSKDECVLVDSVCPYDCFVSVNAEHEDAVGDVLMSVESDCTYSCLRPAGVDCVENKCTVVNE